MSNRVEKVVIYGKPGCTKCTDTLKHLGIEPGSGDTVSYVDISQDRASLEVVLSLGYLQAPVVVIKGSMPVNQAGDPVLPVHWSGYRPDLLDTLKYHLQ